MKTTEIDLVEYLNRKGNIEIECINTNCRKESLTYTTYLIPPFFNGSVTLTMNDKENYLMLFPKPDYNKITIYHYDLQKFFQVNVDKPSSNTYNITISGASCNPEGNVYVRQNLKLDY